MKKRSGVTLIETMIASLVLSMAAMVMLRISVAISQKNTDIREFAALQASAVSIAEQLQYDLNRGVDIFSEDYSQETDDLLCHVFIVEDHAYERPIYFVKMTLRLPNGKVVLEPKFMLGDTAWEAQDDA